MLIPKDTLWWIIVHPTHDVRIDKKEEDYVLSIGKDGNFYINEKCIGKFVMSNIINKSKFLIEPK
jgi:hypothetical protein